MSLSLQRFLNRPLMYVLYFLPLIITLEIFVHPYLVEYYIPFKTDQEYHVLLALFDNFGHFLVAIITWAIVIEYTLNIRTLLQLIYSGLIASFLDIDHFIMARSVKLKDAVSLHERPFFHNSTLPQFLILLVLLSKYTRHGKWNQMSMVALITYTAVMSHQLSDARRRGLWIWPIGSTYPLKDGVFICIFGLLIALSKTCLFYVLNLRAETRLMRVFFERI